MAGKEASNQNPKSLHPVYSVTDITHKVRILDGTKMTYSSWVKLFQLHARGYKVLEHIDGTKPPAKTDPSYNEWCEIDAIVLQWIYGTLSDDYLVRVLEPESTTYEAWGRIKDLFLNNKGARAAALEHEFNNLSFKAMPSFDAYCQRLKSLSEQLNDVDSPVNNQRLVLQLVRGLPVEFDPVASYINQTIPTWETAVSMVQLELHRQAARETLSGSSSTALAAESHDSQPQPYRRFNQSRGGHRPTHGSRPNQNRSSGPRPNQSRNSRGPSTSSRQPNPWKNSGSLQSNQLPVWPGWWTPPPSPYPTMPWGPWSGPPANSQAPRDTSGPNTAGPSRQSTSFQTGPQAHVTQYDAMDPTQLGEAFQAMSMTPPDDQWYMDSGASDHFTGDTGLPEWEDALPPQ